MIVGVDPLDRSKLGARLNLASDDVLVAKRPQIDALTRSFLACVLFWGGQMREEIASSCV